MCCGRRRGDTVDAVGCSLGGVGTLIFSISNILDTGIVPVDSRNRPLHAIGVGSNCSLRLTTGRNILLNVVANKHARTIHGHFASLNFRSKGVCVNSSIGVRSCRSFHSHRNLGSRRVLCMNSSVPSLRIVHRYNLPYYPGSTIPRMGTITHCVSCTRNNCNYNHSVIRRMLGIRKL